MTKVIAWWKMKMDYRKYKCHLLTTRNLSMLAVNLEKYKNFINKNWNNQDFAIDLGGKLNISLIWKHRKFADSFENICKQLQQKSVIS